MEQNVICGNNIELLKSYPDNHFDAIVTDPPYGLGKEPNAEDMLREWLKSGYMEVKGGGFMGKEWDAFVPQPIFWKEVFRVLKPGGYVLAFYGTRTYDWGVMAMRLAGFEVRDCIQWLYGSGFPKSHNISKAIDKMEGAEREVLGVYDPRSKFDNSIRKDRSIGGQQVAPSENSKLNITAPATPQAKQWEGWGSALKPAVEPIVVCRKPLEKGLSIAENVLKWGVGGINIDGCRVGEEVAKEYTSQDTQGRFPANIILECICDEVIKGEKGEVKKTTRDRKYDTGDSRWDGLTSKQEGIDNYNDKGDTHTNPDCPCYIMDRQSGISKPSKGRTGIKGGSPIHQSKMRVDVEGTWPADNGGGASRFFYQAKVSKKERNRGLEGFANNHPTIKPVKLMQYLVRLVTPPNGLVLDPFCGSGTTGIACRLEGFNFVGLEMEEDYAKIAQARIDNWFGASAKESVPESSSLVESASAEDSASARLEPPKEIHTQLKFNF